MRITPFAVLFTLWSAVALAEPSRVRLLVHAEHELASPVALDVSFVLPNLVTGFTPNVYTELNWHAAPWLDIAPTIGWAFKPDAVIASLRLTPHYEKFWGWVDFEDQPQNGSCYWFVQAEYKLLPWLDFGAEEESWGTLTKFSTFSNGGGPNVLVRFGKWARLDLACHTRKNPDQPVGEEFFLRFHIFL